MKREWTGFWRSCVEAFVRLTDGDFPFSEVILISVGKGNHKETLEVFVSPRMLRRRVYRIVDCHQDDRCLFGEGAHNIFHGGNCVHAS